MLGPPESRGGNKAAEWRLRVKKQRAVNSRLKELGELALLSGSSLLTLAFNGSVKDLERYTNWRTTLEESPVWGFLNPVQQGQLKGAKHANYTRIEASIRSLGQMICLSIKDLNDPIIVNAFSDFKLLCIKHAFKSDQTCDEVITYIKWLGKVCQALFLRSQLPEAPSGFTSRIGEIFLPFDGELAFISRNLCSGSIRKQPMDFKQAQKLAQIGNVPRSLPYPSQDQVKSDVKRTLETVQQSTTTPAKSISDYRLGLNIIKSRLPEKKVKTHVSLVGSGCYETSRSEGGRARFLIMNAKTFTNLPYTEGERLIGKIDQFGLTLVHPATWALLQSRLSAYEQTPTLGTILYVPVQELEQVLENDLVKGRKVPKYLGHILNMTASSLIRELGSYNVEPQEINKLIYFEPGTKVRFILELTPKVKADVSIEAGLKSRLITSAMAAYAHLGQLPANYMRSFLSQDPFHRVGFQEADKLWEVLKQYRKESA
jgi:hypothetical protein